jgi:hypothetical protein
MPGFFKSIFRFTGQAAEFIPMHVGRLFPQARSKAHWAFAVLRLFYPPDPDSYREADKKS